MAGWLLWLACAAPAPAPESPAPAERPSTSEPEWSGPVSPVELHVGNLRFRDNSHVFNGSANWLEDHRDEALPIMFLSLEEEDPAAIGITYVLRMWDEPRAVPALEKSMASSDDRLSFESARALAAIHDPEAVAALRRGAASSEPIMASNALRGLGMRGDSAQCDVVVTRVGEADPVGYQAGWARDTLGCP